MTNNSQAVRMPAEAHFHNEIHQVVIEVVGNTRVLIPLESVWES